MSTEIEKTKRFGLTIKRGPGGRTTYSDWGNSIVEKELTDRGASITFRQPFIYKGEFYLNINFGYTSESFKEYSRSIDLDFGQTIELIKYLNDCIYKELKMRDYAYYLAYGSNILSSKIKERAPSATKISNIKLIGYMLVLNKKSKDGSTKANLTRTENDSDIVYCVLYEIRKTEKLELDRIEGLGKGYNEIEIEISLDSLGDIKMTSYVADEKFLVDNELPYDSYMGYIIKGAEENEFPEDYIETLKKIKTKPDPNKSDI